MTFSKKSPSLPTAFDSLRAEHEGEWLNSVFVQPDNFLAMAGMRSFVLFGGEGSGKTALRIALHQYVSKQESDTAPLGIRWHPVAIHAEPGEIVQVFMKQMLDACAQELLYYSYRHPNILKNALPWVKEAVAWFIQTFFSGDWKFELERLESEYQTQDTDGLHALISNAPRSILTSDAPSARIIAMVSSIAKNLGVRGVWAFVDGMETWIDLDKEYLVYTLKALLSTLALFEDPGFIIKMMVPSQLEEDLLSANSTIRRRWDIHKLNWSNEQLTQIIENRAKVMLGSGSYKIKDLYSGKDLQKWLKTYGGTSPRGWLELARPLFEYQLSKKVILPLSQKEFVEIYSKPPPKLRVDLNTDKIFLGYGEITTLQPLAKRLLRYIYMQRNRTCTREDLYYKASKGLSVIPQSRKDDYWVGREQWEKSIDTALYRIRQVIEPDPQKPIYLISDTGKSIVHLDNVW